MHLRSAEVCCELPHPIYDLLRKIGQFVDIHYFIVDVHLRSENDLVSGSGRKDCVNYFGINSSFVNRISGIDTLIVSGLADNLDCVHGNHLIPWIDILPWSLESFLCE